MNLSTVPRGRVLHKIPKEGQPPGLRRMASTSTNPPKRDMFELGPRSESRLSFDFTRQPQSHAYTGRSGPSGLAWPFHTKSQTNKSVNSLPASKFRVVGRGGSGSKLRQVSLSSPIVVLEADISSQRQPLDHGTPFYRPTGRGGLGSLSTNPPTVLKPLKPPTAILDRFLRGRKQSQVQLDEQYRIHKTSPRRSQSLYYRPQQIQKDVVTESDRVVDLSVIYTLEGPGTSMSQNMHPASEDSSSYIEETMRRTSNEHRERSLNKLTRTLGAHPLTITDDLQTSRSPIFDNFSEGDKPGTHHDHKRDSFESDSLSSPMTFAPPSIENAPHSKQTPAPPTSDVDSITTTSREDSCSASAESESSMPHLHVSTHSTSDSVSNDVHPASDPNGPVAKSDWLVPLNEVVISSRRTAPSKPQSWTGEWNRDVKDVIRDLRRL